jgi:glycosyltransferase involved in cell wall biosynthesis
MLATNEDQNGSAPAPTDAEGRAPQQRHRSRSNGSHARTANRLPPLLAGPPARKGDTRPVLALFCYEHPDSPVGRFIGRLAGALARRSAVHVFARHGFEPASAAAVHAVGECPGADLPGQVEEFTRRACDAFAEQFPATSAPITLLGCEWSSVPALTRLRGLRQLDTLLAVHSLERQRSDLSSAVSKRIEEIELTGLRDAKAVLFHEPATAEVARYWVPECADRIVCLRQPFALERFCGNVDPGTIKARYQIGPLDPTILYVGDLDERYGPDLLVKALPGVLKNHPQARLIVAGAGGLYWPLRVYARYLLLEHAVRLPGSVEGPAADEMIQAADVVVVPSRQDTPWWPILAAWAARRPVVATHPAAPGLLEHERDGVLVYPSENSLVWGIERVLFDADLARAIGQRGYEKLEERFGWNGVAAQVEGLMRVPVSDAS